jgi:hypothetical protein
MPSGPRALQITLAMHFVQQAVVEGRQPAAIRPGARMADRRTSQRMPLQITFLHQTATHAPIRV